MPKISNFYGIAIYMYYNDHNPPHFHAYYNKKEVLIDINNMGVLVGKIPGRAMGLVIEWADIHQQELLENWERARNHEELEPISPLK